jgi:glycosyltransferase involved in cell wall biosynthesis
MNTPLVTVLMPVYNSERFLRRAIESILTQTFTDFEFLIINDGSTDQSVAIIQSYTDERITLVHNEKNCGIIDTLNKGIALAKGKYIARMDADDISLPTRFERQVQYLEQHPKIAVLATHIFEINAEEEKIGTWDKDIQNNVPEDIYRTMAKTCCIAHPTVMMQTAIIRNYLYNKKQKGSEDWDLWMRLLSDGKRIDKVPEFLLRYRMHAASITAVHNREVRLEKKINKVRFTFLKNRIKKLRFKKFELFVVFAIVRTFARDIKINQLPNWMRFWKRLFTISPIQASKDFSLLKRLVIQAPNKEGIFFFFPYTHVGGAEKVHAQITETAKDKTPWIFFTGFSANKKFLPLFQENGQLLDIVSAIRHPFFKERSKQLIIKAIEACETPVVFGCNNLFFYELVPSLSNKVKVIELMHDFRYDGEENNYKPYLSVFLRCNERIFISQRAIEQTKKFYRANSVEPLYLDRLKYVPNYVDVPSVYEHKSETEALTVIYVGRGTEEKRAFLVPELARYCFAKNIPVQFIVVGDIEQPADLKNNPSIEFTGELTGVNQLRAIYKKADLLLITSYREGFPMAIMEGMAQGVIPISTPVGDIPKHIQPGKTGYLTSSIEPHRVIDEMEMLIQLLIEQKEKKALLSKNAFEYARENFSKEKFTEAYRKMLMQ